MWQEFSEIQSPRLRSTTLNSYSPPHVKQHGEKHIVSLPKFPQKELPNLHLYFETEVLGRTQVTSEQHPIQGLWTLRGWWTLGDLNPRPSGCKPDALPTELSALVVVAVSLSLLSLHLTTAEESDAVNRCITVRTYANTGAWHTNNGFEFCDILLRSSRKNRDSFSGFVSMDGHSKPLGK